MAANDRRFSTRDESDAWASAASSDRRDRTTRRSRARPGSVDLVDRTDRDEVEPLRPPQAPGSPPPAAPGWSTSPRTQPRRDGHRTALTGEQMQRPVGKLVTLHSTASRRTRTRPATGNVDDDDHVVGTRGPPGRPPIQGSRDRESASSSEPPGAACSSKKTSRTHVPSVTPCVTGAVRSANGCVSGQTEPAMAMRNTEASGRRPRGPGRDPSSAVLCASRTPDASTPPTTTEDTATGLRVVGSSGVEAPRSSTR